MKTNVSDTSIDFYHSPEGQRALGAQEGRVLDVLFLRRQSLTLSEIAREFEQRWGQSLPESTISGRLHDLLTRGLVEEVEERRACAVTGRRKKVWRWVRQLKPGEGEQRGLF